MVAGSSSSGPPWDTSPAVRDYLVDALWLDLVGPSAASELADERLPGWVRPSNWYLTGFLIPSDTPFGDRRVSSGEPIPSGTLWDSASR